jgi:hypothetical protein
MVILAAIGAKLTKIWACHSPWAQVTKWKFRQACHSHTWVTNWSKLYSIWDSGPGQLCLVHLTEEECRKLPDWFYGLVLSCASHLQQIIIPTHLVHAASRCHKYLILQWVRLGLGISQRYFDWQSALLLLRLHIQYLTLYATTGLIDPAYSIKLRDTPKAIPLVPCHAT